MNRNIIITATLLTFLMSGCASVKPANLRPVEPGTKLKVEAFGSAEYSHVDGSERFAKGALGGTAGGAVVGFGAGFVTGFGCGPLFVLCSPIAAIAGTGVGAVVGGVAGGIHGAVTSLPKEQAEKLNLLLNRTFAEQHLDAVLKDHFISQATPTFTLVENDPHTRVTLTIESLRFQQHSKDELTLHMTVSMRVAYGFDMTQQTKPHVFQHISSRNSVDYWLGAEGNNLMIEFDQGLRNLSGQTVALLEHPIGNT
jgi:hypothetical protein